MAGPTGTGGSVVLPSEAFPGVHSISGEMPSLSLSFRPAFLSPPPTPPQGAEASWTKGAEMGQVGPHPQV